MPKCLSCGGNKQTNFASHQQGYEGSGAILSYKLDLTGLENTLRSRCGPGQTLGKTPECEPRIFVISGIVLFYPNRGG